MGASTNGVIHFAAGYGEARKQFLVDEERAEIPGSGSSPNRCPPLTRRASTRSAELTLPSPGRSGWDYTHEEEVHAMKTITIEVPDETTLPFVGSDEQFRRELMLAAAIFWYDRGLISQGKGAEIAGLTRAEFIDALGRANVSAIQTTVEELKAELEQPLDARR